MFSIDVVKAQQEAKKMPHCPLEIRASEADNAMGAEYFEKNADKLKAELLKYGAIWFRGFDLMKSVKGYRQMYESLGLDPCLDPLHSSGLRKFASERDALYEEVRLLLLSTLIWFCVILYSNCIIAAEGATLVIFMSTMILNPPVFVNFYIAGKQTIHAWSLYWITL